jgi:hypothetical protein
MYHEQKKIFLARLVNTHFYLIINPLDTQNTKARMNLSRTHILKTQQNKLIQCRIRLWHSALWPCVAFYVHTSDSEKHSNSLFKVRVNTAIFLIFQERWTIRITVGREEIKQLFQPIRTVNNERNKNTFLGHNMYTSYTEEWKYPSYLGPQQFSRPKWKYTKPSINCVWQNRVDQTVNAGNDSERKNIVSQTRQNKLQISNSGVQNNK